MNKRYKVAQIGTFDVENYGDLLFPTLFKKRFKEYEIDLFSPKGGKKPFEKETYVYPLSKLDDLCNKKKYDALVIGGGDLIRLDDQVASIYKKSFESSLSIWLFPIVLGKKYKIPVIFNAPGVPYYFNSNQEKIIKKIMNNVDYVSVRDNESKNILVRAGIKNVSVIPDTILCIDEFISKEENKKIKDKLIKEKKVPNIDNYIVVQHNPSNINNELYINEIKKLISLITDKYNYNVLLLPIGYIHNDIEFLEKVYDKNNKKLRIVTEKLTPLEMLSVLSCSKGYVGTSMHGAITTYAYKNPIMIINVKKLVKIGGLLENINCKDVEVNDISNLCNTFEKKFFKSYNEKNHIIVKSKIEKHFDKICKLIEDPAIGEINNYERDLLTEVFTELSKLNEKNLDFANVYLDYGNDFNEEEKKTLKIEKSDNNYKIKFDLPKNVKRIRIDLIEEKYLKLDSFIIKIDNENINYEMLECITTQNKNYFVSLDPKIIVNTKQLNRKQKVEIVFSGEILEYYVMNNFMKDIYNEINETTKKYELLNYKVHHRIKYFIKKILRKL